MLEEKPMHHKTREKLEREAKAKAEQEGTGSDAPTATPPASVFEEPIPAPVAESAIFGGQAPTPPADTIAVDKNAWNQMLKGMQELNEFKRQVMGEAIDPNNPQKKKKIVKIPFYVTEEGEEFIVTGLEDKRMIDGAISKTFPRGRDELTDQIITWCRPIMINLKTGILEPVKDIRYDEFSNVVRTIPLEVKHEETVPVNLTTIVEEVEIANYQEKGGYLNRRGTGQMTKTAVWGVKTLFVIEYEQKDYKIDDSVINYK